MGENAREAHPIIVGRIRELETLQSCLSQVIQGKGRTVMISGEAGIGKTKLTEELGRLARMTNCRFLVGRCLPHATAPYLPFRDALQGLATKDPLVEGTPGDARSPSGRSCQGLADPAADTGAGGPPLADTATVQVIHFLSRNISCMQVYRRYVPARGHIFEVAEGLYHPFRLAAPHAPGVAVHRDTAGGTERGDMTSSSTRYSAAGCTGRSWRRS